MIEALIIACSITTGANCVPLGVAMTMDQCNRLAARHQHMYMEGGRPDMRVSCHRVDEAVVVRPRRATAPVLVDRETWECEHGTREERRRWECQR